MTAPAAWRAFPTELLPGDAANFVRETAAAVGCDPAMVAVPALAALGSSIGTTRCIQLRGGGRPWREYPIIWCAVVAPSATLKSPAQAAALEPLHNIEVEFRKQFGERVADYERAVLEYAAALKDWQRKKEGPPPEKPEPPVCPRLLTHNATVEALAVLLAENPRGLLVCPDELGTWLRGFNSYKAAGRGADVEGWLQLWQARPLAIDRKTGDRPRLYIRRAAASVCGTVQPRVLARVLTADFFDNGLAARILFVAPPTSAKRWSERTASRDVCERFDALIRELVELKHVEGPHGPDPVVLPLSEDARRIWAGWFDVHAERTADAPTDRGRAALGKIEAYAARFALIVTMADDPFASEVPAEAMARATALADWFADEVLRVYGLLADAGDRQEADELIEYTRRHGGVVDLRDLARRFRKRFAGRVELVRVALEPLIEAGRGRLAYVRSPSGGRSKQVFVLTETAAGRDTTPPGAIKNGGCVLSQQTEARRNGDGVGPGPDAAEWAGEDERPPDSVYLAYPEVKGADDAA